MSQTVTMLDAQGMTRLNRYHLQKFIDNGILRYCWSGRKLLIFEDDIILLRQMIEAGDIVI